LGTEREWDHRACHPQCRRGELLAVLPILQGIMINVFQALLGFERQMKHLDGRIITLGRTGTTQPGEVEVVEGEGVRPRSLWITRSSH